MTRDPSLVINALARHADLMVANDLRVGQFIENAMSRANRNVDLFYVEDDLLANILDGYAAYLRRRG